MRKTVAAAAMAASLTVGGAAGVALFTPTPSAAQTGGTAEEPTADPERPILVERIRRQLAPLVEDQVVDAGQADAVAEHLAEQAPLRHHRGGFGPGFGDEVLEVLGLEAAELREQLAAGRSLADVAEARGVDVQQVIDAILAAQEEHLDELVDRTFEGRPGRHGPGRHGGPGPSSGDTGHDPADDETTDS